MKGNNIFLTATKSCKLDEENSTNLESMKVTTSAENQTTVTESTTYTDSTTLSTNYTTMSTDSIIEIDVNMTTNSYNFTTTSSTTVQFPLKSNSTLPKNSSCKFDEIFHRLQNNLSKVKIEIIEERIVPSTTTQDPYLFLAALNTSDYKDLYGGEVQ